MGKTQLRVLTYNVHSGAGMDGRLDLARIAAVIRAARPDLVALQEVDRGARRSAGVDQAARFGELTGLHAVFAKATEYSGGDYGQAVLSRRPPAAVRTHFLPTGPGSEPRIAIEADVPPGGGWPALTFIATHLTWEPPEERPAQVARLNELFARPGGGLAVLAGDFNSEPRESAMQALRAHWADATDAERTHPADRPEMKIDYILWRPAARLRVAETRVIAESVASDHRPVLSVFELAGGDD